jgi:hypothetical protein
MYQASTSRTRAHTAADSESVGEAYHDAALVTHAEVSPGWKI